MTAGDNNDRACVEPDILATLKHDPGTSSPQTALVDAIQPIHILTIPSRNYSIKQKCQRDL